MSVGMSVVVVREREREGGWLAIKVHLDALSLQAGSNGPGRWQTQDTERNDRGRPEMDMSTRAASSTRLHYTWKWIKWNKVHEQVE
jgi:hypothetical protein